MNYATPALTKTTLAGALGEECRLGASICDQDG